MNIVNISKQDRQVIVILSADDLVDIANSLYKTTDDRSKCKRLYADIMMCRDLCQYGHIDDWCLEKIAQKRGILQKKEKNNEAVRTE